MTGQKSARARDFSAGRCHWIHRCGRKLPARLAAIVETDQVDSLLERPQSTTRPPAAQTGDKPMEESKVDMFMMINNNNLPLMSLSSIRQQLLALPDERSSVLHMTQLKNPTTAIILSVLIGHFGIDRFYIGDTGLGIAKLLTCGGLGIWTLVDWFLIMGLARERNYEKLAAAIA
jgi:TM2 domain-containing membrane protein YozV